MLDPETFGFGAAGRLHGGELFRISEPFPGQNEPSAGEEFPEAEPSIDAPRVPQGWDTPAHVVDGLLHPAIRRPVLPSGEPWPVATHDAVKTRLALQGRMLPSMTLLVPQDGVGPMLSGDTARGDDLAPPPGYDAVMLFGTPQTVFGQDPRPGAMKTGTPTTATRRR